LKDWDHIFYKGKYFAAQFHSGLKRILPSNELSNEILRGTFILRLKRGILSLAIIPHWRLWLDSARNF
jgi:hypothetical protein